MSGVTDRGGHTEVRTSAGAYRSDAVVIAAGVWSREPVRGLGLDVDLVAGNGYSFSVGGRTAALPPGPPRRGQGGAHSDGQAGPGRRDDGVRARRRPVPAAARRGHRRRRAPVSAPCRRGRPPGGVGGAASHAPDGLPLIGPVSGHPRVLLATGHHMLAPATGRLVAGQLTGTADSSLSSAFAPVRSVRRYSWRVRATHGQ
ncbi:FAD-binding oxidoreductase [Streptomyces sp. AgN23]|nr:FAD-binding oxidoreductase [Streptomyces sp. AgN23]